MADTLTAGADVSPTLKDDPGAYFQAWYPIHVSASLAQGQLIGRDFLGTRVILYRDKDGRAVVQSAYCPHLGADLSQGELIGGEVRCPYHHWQFGADGKCTKIPPQPNIPAAARIYNYPTEEKWGLVWAFNGPEAIDLARQFVPEIGFLDIGLPVMDGYELARRLRALPGCDGMHLVAVTGYGQSTDRQLSREAGFENHLVKPVELDEVERIITRL